MNVFEGLLELFVGAKFCIKQHVAHFEADGPGRWLMVVDPLDLVLSFAVIASFGSNMMAQWPETFDLTKREFGCAA